MAPSDPFAGIIGHEPVLAVLRRMLAGGRMAHAFLFIGREGVGRTIVAEAFLAALLPESPLVSHPNFLSLAREENDDTGKRKSAISVEQIRAMRERLSLSAAGGGWKAVFIEEADAMNAASANALLKTLEEPTSRTLLILRAPGLESVPATIASRCQIIRFYPVPSALIASALERRGLDREEAGDLAQQSAGCPGHAIRMLTDGAFRSEWETAAASFASIAHASIPERFRTVADCLPKDEANKAEVAVRILNAWETQLREILHTNLSQCLPTACEQEALAAVLEAIEAVRKNGNPQIALEHAALRL